MNRRQHIDTVRRVQSQSVGLANLQKELAAEKQNDGESRMRTIVGRPVSGTEGLNELVGGFDQLDMQLKAYRPAVVYASETLLQNALDTANYESRANAFVEQARRVWPQLGDSLSIATYGLRLKFMNDRRAALSIKLLRDKNTHQLNQERTFVREALSPGSTDARSLKPLVVSLGVLELSAAMRGAMPEEILEGRTAPEFLQLEPVDAIRL